MPYQSSTALSRRGFLKLSAISVATLSVLSVTASLSGCSSDQASSSFQVLRNADADLLSAVLPVLYQGASRSNSTVKPNTELHSTLQAIDNNLAHFSPAMRKLTLQLFDVLNNPLTRGPLTGVWRDWEQASITQIQNFLLRWENSRFNLLKMGHSALLQLAMLAHYGQPEAWQHCGYPGPPQLQ